MRAAGAVRGAVGVAPPLDRDGHVVRVRIEEHVDRPRAMPAGEDHRARAEREHRASASALGFLLARAPRPRGSSPASTRASGRFGVITLARGRICSTSARCASGVEQPRARLGDHHRVETTGVPGGSSSSAPATASVTLARAEHPDLDGVDADVGEHSAHLREHDLGGTGGRADANGVLGGDRGDRASCRARRTRRTPSGRPGCRRRRRSPSRRS